MNRSSLHAFRQAIVAATAAATLTAAAGAAQVPPPVRPAKDGTLVYAVGARGDHVPDFSHAGFGGGGVALPRAVSRVRVEPVEGDDGARIQLALDYVATLAPGADGLRGAVELAPGRYDIAGQIRLTASGVVLRGAGTSMEHATVLVATGTDRR